MKFCKDCEHHERGLCLSPENGIDPVSDGPKARNAAINRADMPGRPRCGFEARFFVPKTSVPWWAFWRKLA